MPQIIIKTLNNKTGDESWDGNWMDGAQYRLIGMVNRLPKKYWRYICFCKKCGRFKHRNNIELDHGRCGLITRTVQYYSLGDGSYHSVGTCDFCNWLLIINKASVYQLKKFGINPDDHYELLQAEKGLVECKILCSEKQKNKIKYFNTKQINIYDYTCDLLGRYEESAKRESARITNG